MHRLSVGCHRRCQTINHVPTWKQNENFTSLLTNTKLICRKCLYRIFAHHHRHTYRKRGIIFELHDFLWIAHVHETSLDQIKSKCFQLRRFIFCHEINDMIYYGPTEEFAHKNWIITNLPACSPCRSQRIWCFPCAMTDWRKFWKWSTKKQRENIKQKPYYSMLKWMFHLILPSTSCLRG